MSPDLVLPCTLPGLLRWCSPLTHLGYKCIVHNSGVHDGHGRINIGADVVVLPEEVEFDLSVATGRSHAAWWLALREVPRGYHLDLAAVSWSRAPAQAACGWALHWLARATTGGGSLTGLWWTGSHGSPVPPDLLADLDPDDPHLLPDGSRWVDAEALRRVVLHLAGVVVAPKVRTADDVLNHPEIGDELRWDDGQVWRVTAVSDERVTFDLIPTIGRTTSNHLIRVNWSTQRWAQAVPAPQRGADAGVYPPEGGQVMPYGPSRTFVIELDSAQPGLKCYLTTRAGSRAIDAALGFPSIEQARDALAQVRLTLEYQPPEAMSPRFGDRLKAARVVLAPPNITILEGR